MAGTGESQSTSTRTTIRRTALFVDFDNIYIGLQASDAEAARAFAESPDRWVDALSTGGVDGAGAFERRWLVRVCYLNPVRFGAFRAFFTRNGFRVVDCPPLTGRQKNSADIHMVLDILDALEHPARYDEFVVASADADFTPVMMRLRAHDRRTAIVTAGPAAAAYRSVCDIVTTPEQLTDALRPSSGSRASPTGSPAPDATTPSQADTSAATDAIDPSVVEAIRRAVADSERPVVAARAAQVALDVAPDLSTQGWGGTGKFTAFVATYLPELLYVPQPQPGYVLDPTRHGSRDLPKREDVSPSDASVVRRVSTVTNVPALSREQYAVLFAELATELEEHGYSRVTIKQVRDRAHLREVPIGRAAIQFVVQGLLYAGTPLTSGTSARDLAESWRDNVLLLSENAQMQLTEEERRELSSLIVGYQGDCS